MTDILKAVADMKYVERERLTMAEIGVDEARTLLERRGLQHDHPLMEMLATVSEVLSSALFEADGGQVRRNRLLRVRKRLTQTFPMSDEDLRSVS